MSKQKKYPQIPKPQEPLLKPLWEKVYLPTDYVPCPFCGEQNSLVMPIGYDTRERLTFYAVCCGHCQARGPSSIDRDQAVVYWNRSREESAHEPE